MVEKEETSAQVTTIESKGQTLPKWRKISCKRLNKIHKDISRRVLLSILSIASLTVFFNQAGCAPRSINLESQPTNDAPTTTEIEITPSAISSATATVEELEPLKVNFGLDSTDFPVENNMTIDDSLSLLAETYKDKPKSYSYILCSLEKPSASRFFVWSGAFVSNSRNSFTDEFRDEGMTEIVEPKIINAAFKVGIEAGVFEGAHQVAALLTRAKDPDDGIERNGIYFRDENGYGVAFYIVRNDEGNITQVETFIGNNITIQDKEVRKLYEMGYTRIENIDGILKGFFNINDLPSRGK